MAITQSQGRQGSEGTRLARNTEEAWLLNSLFLPSLEFFRFDNVEAVFLALLLLIIVGLLRCGFLFLMNSITD